MGLFLRTYFEEQAPSIQSPAMSMDSFFRAAHDLRSPLSAVNLTIHHMKKSSPHLDHLALLDEAISRINSIAEDILQARKQQQQQITKPIESFDLFDSVKCFAREAKFQLHHSMDLVGFNKSLSQGSTVLGNKSDLHRILWNLLQNAQEAKANCLSLTWEMTTSQVIIKIQDNGAGIPAKVLRKIGQEGFTTKPNGNGLGLYSAIQTLRSWQGDLTIASQRNIGTTIELTFTKA